MKKSGAQEALQDISVRPGSLTLGDRVAVELESRILRGELAPSERLATEAELCDLLGVSRSVVRDAVRTLSARGLVTVQQGHGIVVAEPSDAAVGEALVALLMRSDLTMEEVIAARAAIETSLAPLAAARATAEDCERIAESLATFEEAVERSEWERASNAHLTFHLGLLNAIHLPALGLLLGPIEHVILLSSLPPRMEDPSLWEVPSHAPVLEALRRRDEARARAAMVEHFCYIEQEAYAEFKATLFREVVARGDYAAFRAKIRSGTRR